VALVNHWLVAESAHDSNPIHHVQLVYSRQRAMGYLGRL
jgi:hypothetical protein